MSPERDAPGRAFVVGAPGEEQVRDEDAVDAGDSEQAHRHAGGHEARDRTVPDVDLTEKGPVVLTVRTSWAITGTRSFRRRTSPVTSPVTAPVTAARRPVLKVATGLPSGRC
ncbi:MULTISPECIES: hypothetical protein [Streptomyces]|uniref:hypothetical protein n=1 Tax=Streptomyces TaxID=1883 RepID=UPI001673A9E7|nr:MULTISPECIES: hypothetical protein [Streptomyces]MBK3522224.1 hypothetical protein [Streptomyces sp. MBT70]